MQSPHSFNNNGTHKSAIIICLICIRRPLLLCWGLLLTPPTALVVRSASSSKQYAIYNCRAIKQLCSLSWFAPRAAHANQSEKLFYCILIKIFSYLSESDLNLQCRMANAKWLRRDTREWQPDYPPLGLWEVVFKSSSLPFQILIKFRTFPSFGGQFQVLPRSPFCPLILSGWSRWEFVGRCEVFA